VVTIDAPEESDLVEQGSVAIRLTNEAEETHGTAMPLSGQVVGVNDEALRAPGAITAETWLVRLLPSHLDDEINNLGRY
jgi:glycine cleavage system H lipoate-binding protein